MAHAKWKLNGKSRVAATFVSPALQCWVGVSGKSLVPEGLPKQFSHTLFRPGLLSAGAKEACLRTTDELVIPSEARNLLSSWSRDVIEGTRESRSLGFAALRLGMTTR